MATMEEGMTVQEMHENITESLIRSMSNTPCIDNITLHTHETGKQYLEFLFSGDMQSLSQYLSVIHFVLQTKNTQVNRVDWKKQEVYEVVVGVNDWD